jgi:hypothetical protein
MDNQYVATVTLIVASLLLQEHRSLKVKFIMILHKMYKNGYSFDIENNI